MRQTCWRRESELRSWNPDHEHDPPGYGVSSVGLREAVAPYLLRGLLLRLAALVQPLCIWNIDLALPIHRVVVGGPCTNLKDKADSPHPPGSVGSLLVVLRTVVAPNYPGAAPCLVVLIQSTLYLKTLISRLIG